MKPDVWAGSSGTGLNLRWAQATACGTATLGAFVPPPRDDGRGDQFPDAPTGVREPRKPGPRAPSGAIALNLPGA